MSRRYIYRVTDVNTSITKELGSMKKVGKFVGVSSEAMADKTTWAIYREIGVESRTGEFETRYDDFIISRTTQGSEVIVEDPIQEIFEENVSERSLINEFSYAYEIFLASIETHFDEYFNNAKELSNKVYPNGAPRNARDNDPIFAYNALEVINMTRNVWQHARGTHYFDQAMELGIDVINEINNKI